MGGWGHRKEPHRGTPKMVQGPQGATSHGWPLVMSELGGERREKMSELLAHAVQQCFGDSKAKNHPDTFSFWLRLLGNTFWHPRKGVWAHHSSLMQAGGEASTLPDLPTALQMPSLKARGARRYFFLPAPARVRREVLLLCLFVLTHSSHRRISTQQPCHLHGGGPCW